MTLALCAVGLLCVATAMLTGRWWLLLPGAACGIVANIVQILQEGPPC